MSLDTAQFCYIVSRIGCVSAKSIHIGTRLPQTVFSYLYESESEKKVHDDRSIELSIGGGKMNLQYVHGIYRGFIRQRLESRGSLEDEGTKRTTTQVLNIISRKYQKTLFT